MNGIKTFFIAIGVAVIVLAVIAGGYWLSYGTAHLRGKVDAENRIESGQSQIQNYQHFFALCSNIQSYNDQLRIAREQLDTESDPGAASRLSTEIRGLEGQRSRAIHRYNADTSQDYTKARFLSAKLPYHIDPAKKDVTCAQ